MASTTAATNDSVDLSNLSVSEEGQWSVTLTSSTTTMKSKRTVVTVSSVRLSHDVVFGLLLLPGTALCLKLSLYCTKLTGLPWLIGGTAAAAPLPFRPGNHALCGSRPLVTPYYCRLGHFLCFVFMSAYCMFDLSVYYLTCKNRRPYNLYCVGGDVKHCSIQSNAEIDWPYDEEHYTVKLSHIIHAFSALWPALLITLGLRRLGRGSFCYCLSTILRLFWGKFEGWL